MHIALAALSGHKEGTAVHRKKGKKTQKKLTLVRVRGRYHRSQVFFVRFCYALSCIPIQGFAKREGGVISRSIEEGEGSGMICWFRVTDFKETFCGETPPRVIYRFLSNRESDTFIFSLSLTEDPAVTKLGNSKWYS